MLAAITPKCQAQNPHEIPNPSTPGVGGSERPERNGGRDADRRKSQNSPPQQPVCPTPSNVSLKGTIVTPPVGPAHFSGFLTDVSTGRTYAVSAFGYGGGLVAGSYDIQATVRGFNALSNGLDIGFVEGPYGTGGAIFTDNNGGSIGEGSVHAAVAPPLGAGSLSFDPPSVTLKNRGTC